MTIAPVIFLPGAGGTAPGLHVFRAGAEDRTSFEVIGYPRWTDYVADDFSAEVLLSSLVGQIATKAPWGPIRIIGLSLGAHLGYAAALRLKALGRDVAGLCAIDSFMIRSSGPSSGWKQRAMGLGLELLSEGRFREFAAFFRSRLWRGLIRASGRQLPSLLRSPAGKLISLLALDPIFEQELSMRLLIRATAPLLASLDQDPVALDVPTILLRTSRAASDDAAWRCRCPNLRIFEIPGQHHSLFDPPNAGVLHKVFVDATGTWRETVKSPHFEGRTRRDVNRSGC